MKGANLNEGDIYSIDACLCEVDEVTLAAFAETVFLIRIDPVNKTITITGSDDYTVAYNVENIEEKQETKPDNEHYTKSSTAGDYGTGNPWDAPGMSIKDFI